MFLTTRLLYECYQKIRIGDCVDKIVRQVPFIFRFFNIDMCVLLTSKRAHKSVIRVRRAL